MNPVSEINLNEMEQAAGGKGGSVKVLPHKDGCLVYQIASGENLTKIAKWYNTTVDKIMAVNVGIIANKNDITAGRYIYIPR